MIFGNEGMPGSGKSLDAMQHILDSLNAGRTIITNIHGINHKAIASYLVSLYCSLAVLTDDAIAVLEDVEINKYHEYK